MALQECPGTDRKKPVVPEEFECPECGAEVEVWTNEEKVTCPACSEELTREQLQAGK